MHGLPQEPQITRPHVHNTLTVARASVVRWTVRLSFLFLTPALGFCFSLHDHTQITKTAFEELNSCGFTFTQQFEDEVILSNLEQDLNLFKKWTRASHYFNPYKALNMRRDDASVSISESESTLAMDGLTPSKQAAALGSAIHYLQDMAVPAHVIPITHTSFSDGFEDLDVSVSTFESDHCHSLFKKALASSLFEILQTTSIQTLHAVSHEVAITLDGQAIPVKWNEAFWKEGSGNDFGDYGTFGNQFGTSQFIFYTSSGMTHSVQVLNEKYTQFKAQQLRAAVTATQMALLWFLRRTSPSTQSALATPAE